MKSEDIQKELAALTQEMDLLREKLSLLVARFQDDVLPVAGSWIKREVERQIEDHPDIIDSIGIEKLKLLKNKLNVLISALPDIARQELANTSDWPHNQKSESNDYRKDTSAPFFEKAFRKIINHLGTLLDEYGLLKEPRGRIASWEKSNEDGIHYAINPGFNDKSMPVVAEYQVLFKEFTTLKSNIESKERDLAKAKARELWESA